METLAAPASRPGSRLGLLAVLGALSSFGPLSMDMYLPSTPTIAANLHASQALVQLTLSGCLAGLAVGQLVAGPVSDGLGRKKPLLVGLAAFTALSVACAAAPDIGALIAFRFLQGMAGAGGVVLSLAIVRDRYTGTELARVLGSLMLVFGLAPVLAPVIGGQILRFTSWRGVFGVLAAIGLLLFLLSTLLPETLPPHRRTPSRLRQLAADSRSLMRDRQYVGYTLAIACGNAALITYISALPFIVEDAYHQSPQLFSVFFMINSIGLVTMAQLGARLVKRVPVARVVLVSQLVMAAGAIGFLAAALTGHPPLAALLVPLFFFLSFFGSMRPNATAIALTNQGAIAGTASAWVGALPFLLGAFLSPLAGLGGEGAATVAGLMLATLCLAGLPCVLLIARAQRAGRQELTRRKRPPAADGGRRLAGWVTMSTDQVDALVIFGATGDLAKLETFPALVGLVERGVLNVPVLGVAKSGWDLPKFRDYAVASLKLNGMDPAAPAAAKLLGLLRYVDGDLGDHATYEAMASALGDVKRLLYYLEVPPPLFGRIAEGISGVGLAARSRVMVEKPFGHDAASARALNDTIHQYFPEEAVYRVDHWLGLDPVESLMFARFANSIIEPLLNRNYVRSIQITMAEAFDVADRGSFYDRTGAIKDVIQNHMLQVLATVLADPPDGTGLDSWISSKSRLIGALRPLTPADVVKGQYQGYQSVSGVTPGSSTETYAAVRLAAETWRWAGVPIAIRAGKCLPVTATEVMVDFKPVPHDVFGLGDVTASNALRFRIYPQSEAVLTLVGKKPGAGWRPGMEDLTFIQHPGADMRPYDRLIGAALNGERWLFAQQDTVEAAWRVVDPVLGEVGPVAPYARQSWGPDSSSLLPPGQAWYSPSA